MDWNRDGNLDIISGCYWTQDEDGAHLQILKGKGRLDFAMAESLKDESGQPLQNVEPKTSKTDTSAICTEQHAVDYDGDGDLDLVVGCFGPKFFYYENKADKADAEPVMSDSPVELPIESTSNHSAPHLVDWDDDGDLDLLSGTADGGVIISENTGSRKKPQWSAFKQLVAPSGLRQQSLGDEIKMAPCTRVWATDWNKDGLLDLLIGDSTTIVGMKEGIDKAEFEKRQKEFDEKMAKLTTELQTFMPEYQKAMEAGEKPGEELEKKIQEYSEKATKIYNSQKEFKITDRTGFVWLLIQKEDSEKVASN